MKMIIYFYYKNTGFGGEIQPFPGKSVLIPLALWRVIAAPSLRHIGTTGRNRYNHAANTQKV